MKAVTVTTMCTQSSGVQSGRIHRQRRDIENEEIQMYLSKLKELVPFMPKNRRLSKLEVIQYVIDYICDLQYALETHPTVNSAVVQASAAAMMRSASPTSTTSPVASPRQPLGVLAPNTILNGSPISAPDVSTTTPSPLFDKVSSPSESRPVSC
uniref:BHLH domain-containing protein n=1 Tax=Clastoptera arizonana TaxID=38151 RepID=A0A1B6CQN5_9HEMI